jgi:maleylpyruvate isomerase
MKLYNFFRSSSSHRLRIALGLKGLAHDYVPVDLRAERHLSPEFRALNPQAMVPALEHQGTVLIQSPAIIEWLEERHPDPPLLPVDPEDRARVRGLAAIIGCDIHPINNRRVLEYLRKQLGCDEADVNGWCATWIGSGFDAFEAMLAADSRRGRFCFGDAPTIADLYLVPQVESARRFNVDLERWPVIKTIDAVCAEIDPFRLAAPALQPDAL